MAIEINSYNRLVILTSLLVGMSVTLVVQLASYEMPVFKNTLSASIQRPDYSEAPIVTSVYPSSVELWRNNVINITGKNLANTDVVVLTLEDNLKMENNFVSSDFGLFNVNEEKSQAQFKISESSFNDLINKTFYVWLRYTDDDGIFHSLKLPHKITFSPIPRPTVSELRAETLGADRILLRKETEMTVTGTNFIDKNITRVMLYNALDVPIAEWPLDSVNKEGTSFTFKIIPTKNMVSQGPIRLRVFNLPSSNPPVGGGMSNSFLTFSVYEY